MRSLRKEEIMEHDTGTINYYELWQDTIGLMRVLSQQLEEAKRTLDATTIREKSLTEKVAELTRQLEELKGDEVSGLPAIVCLYNRLDSLLAEAKRFRHNHPDEAEYPEELSFSLVVITIDQLDHLVDKYGKAYLNLILAFVSRVIRSQIRACDIACRYKESKIVILLPKCPEIDTIRKMRKITMRVFGENFQGVGETINITLTVGICNHKSGATKEELFTKAEAAMRFGKERGPGDCVAVCQKDGECKIVDQLIRNHKTP